MLRDSSPRPLPAAFAAAGEAPDAAVAAGGIVAWRRSFSRSPRTSTEELAFAAGGLAGAGGGGGAVTAGLAGREGAGGVFGAAGGAAGGGAGEGAGVSGAGGAGGVTCGCACDSGRSGESGGACGGGTGGRSGGGAAGRAAGAGASEPRASRFLSASRVAFETSLSVSKTPMPVTAEASTQDQSLRFKRRFISSTEQMSGRSRLLNCRTSGRVSAER